MMAQQQAAHAQLAAAAQAQAQVQAAHAQAAAHAAAAQQAHLQAQVHQVHHHPPHAQPHKQHEIITEEKLQEKGEREVNVISAVKLSTPVIKCCYKHIQIEVLKYFSANGITYPVELMVWSGGNYLCSCCHFEP
jgi:hypothetical protein